jgi:RNA polymerase sigma-70 factor (ECF subfamily)
MQADEIPTDHTLLARVQLGQDDAATQLYLRYAQRLRALAVRRTADDLKSRVDPEDIVQSVFRTFFRRVSRGEYSVPEGEELWKLFLVIALNKVRTVGAYHHAAMRDTRQTGQGADFDHALHGNSGHDEEALNTLRMTIEEMLEGLTPEQRQVISLRIDGYDVAAIAQKTGRAKRSVERLLQEFRKAMATQLDMEI